MARLRHSEIPVLEKQLAEASTTARSASSDDGTGAAGIAAATPMVKGEVGLDDVADVVSSWTGIPADRLYGGETGDPHARAQAESAAGRVYDVEIVLRRQPGGVPPLESAAASVESVRLDPELKRAMLIRAAEEQISVSDVIRRAIGGYLRTS
jgi:hypothetical protein